MLYGDLLPIALTKYYWSAFKISQWRQFEHRANSIELQYIN